MQSWRLSPGVAVGAMMGTILEWYEAFVFIQGARYIGAAFFPSGSPLASLLATFTVFAIGFAMRPIGALFWGWYGDRHGRRHVMLWTLALGGISVGLIGAVPPHSAIGIAAPAVVTALRLVQGFSLGGEWGAAVNYIFENARRYRRFLLSLVQSAVALGLFLAAAVFLALSSALLPSDMASWGWRIAYLLSLIAVAIGLLFRLKFGETLEFLEAKSAERAARSPIGEVFARHLHATAVGIILAGMAGAVFYYGNAFAPNLAAALKAVTPQQQFEAVMAFAAVELLGVFLGGLYAERFGTRIPIITAAAIMLIPSFLISLAFQGFAGLLAIATLTGLAHGLIYTPEAGFLAEVYPTLARTTGLSVSYQFGNAIFAATAPTIMTLLYKYGAMAAASYLIALIIATMILVATFRPARR